MTTVAAESEFGTAGASDVAKKPVNKPTTEKKPYNVRLETPIAARIEATAATLGLDETNFLRMLVIENLPRYEKKAAQIRAGDHPED